MGIATQAADPASTLCRFLDARLPHRGRISENWARKASKAPWSAIAVEADRQQLGRAAEMRIGLDLAKAPGYWDLLSFLPPEQCRTLLSGAGYSQDGYEHLADTGTTDPLLLQWERSAHPVCSGDTERAALAACWDATSMYSLAQTLSEYSAQLRRSCLSHARDEMYGRDGSGVKREAAITALTHLWNGYLRHGRRQLISRGERVLLALPLAGGFGIADLVAGRSLVEIKVVLEPAEHFQKWLDQLLGYVLLDWFDVLGLNAVGLYLGWQAVLISTPLNDILTTPSPGPLPSLSSLREEFRRAIAADLDWTIEAQLRNRYPIPLISS